MTDPDLPGWTGVERFDGVRVAESNRKWIVRRHDGYELLSSCLCCGLPFRTAHAAKLAANAMIGPPTKQ